MTKHPHKTATPYLLVLPYFLLYFAFSLFPILFSLAISFTDWNGFSSMTFVGLSNYVRLFFHDVTFYQALYHTLLVMVVALPLSLGLGLFLAAMLKDYFNKSRNVFQLVNFLPYITTPVAIGILFQILFDWKAGTVNAVLVALHVIKTPIYWLGFAWPARAVVVILLVWQGFGYMMVMFLAGLSTIPAELYEAAKIDGAKWKDAFFRITIPMLRPIMTFVLITGIIAGFRLFDEPQLLFQSEGQPIGGPDHAVETVVMNFYQAAFRDFSFGYGAAIAYGLFIVIFIFSFISMRMMNRGNEAGL
ncbi:MAG TPA: sugar ABC transporter permease [Spirochaetia bacterium]|nr:sugar ABC transporter permease [Spirochaetia bacterium]